jgi:hypothetical protein
MAESEFRVLGVQIDRPFAAVAAFLAAPANFAAWASGMATSLREDAGRWVAETPAGIAEIRFSPPNPFGVADHQVLLPGGVTVSVPLRAVAWEEGSLVTLTLFRLPAMDDARWAADIDWVTRDLQSLKRCLER